MFRNRKKLYVLSYQIIEPNGQITIAGSFVTGPRSSFYEAYNDLINPANGWRPGTLPRIDSVYTESFRANKLQSSGLKWKTPILVNKPR